MGRAPAANRCRGQRILGEDARRRTFGCGPHSAQPSLPAVLLLPCPGEGTQIVEPVQRLRPVRWRSLIVLLEHLGADISRASMVNGGDLIDEATTRDWAERLSGVVGRAVRCNHRAEFVWLVDGLPVRSPFIPSPRYSLTGRPRSAEPIEEPDPQVSQRFLEEMVRFFGQCGGFQQC